MGDMGDTFKAMQENIKAHRAEMLAKADTTGWTEHTPYHFSRTINGERIEWWPSGGKVKYQGKMVYGHKKIEKLFSKILRPTNEN